MHANTGQLAVACRDAIKRLQKVCRGVLGQSVPRYPHVAVWVLSESAGKRCVIKQYQKQTLHKQCNPITRRAEVGLHAAAALPLSTHVCIFTCCVLHCRPGTDRACRANLLAIARQRQCETYTKEGPCWADADNRCYWHTSATSGKPDCRAADLLEVSHMAGRQPGRLGSRDCQEVCVRLQAHCHRAAGCLVPGMLNDFHVWLAR